MDVEDTLKNKGIHIDISSAGKYANEAKESLVYLDQLTDKYKNTVVSYSIDTKRKTGNVLESRAAYWLNGKTAVSIIPSAFKKIKAADGLKLGDNQHLGITYHEFAHSLSQSREKTDKEFWKEIRRIKREYQKEKGGSELAQYKDFRLCGEGC